jgi:crossover junction endodeoxyribonuclease RusA
MITLHLPWPPSVNHLWRHKGNKIYLNPRYKAWRKEAGWTMKVEGNFTRIDVPFSAILLLSPPNKSRRDLDNIIKPVLDLLQDLQWIKNDSLCQELTVKWDKSLPVGVTVTIAPY